jgi:hypothetical protein
MKKMQRRSHHNILAVRSRFELGSSSIWDANSHITQRQVGHGMKYGMIVMNDE